MNNAIGVATLALVLAGIAGQRLPAATIAVDAFSDDATQNGNCTLREAIQAAQTNSPVDHCPAGSASGVDVVQMPIE